MKGTSHSHYGLNEFPHIIHHVSNANLCQFKQIQLIEARSLIGEKPCCFYSTSFKYHCKTMSFCNVDTLRFILDNKIHLKYWERRFCSDILFLGSILAKESNGYPMIPYLEGYYLNLSFRPSVIDIAPSDRIALFV